jgi:hypothetical protein
LGRGDKGFAELSEVDGHASELITFLCGLVDEAVQPCPNGILRRRRAGQDLMVDLDDLKLNMDGDGGLMVRRMLCLLHYPNLNFRG